MKDKMATNVAGRRKRCSPATMSRLVVVTLKAVAARTAEVALATRSHDAMRPGAETVTGPMLVRSPWRRTAGPPRR